MNKSPTVERLAAALTKAQASIQPAEKNGTNYYGEKYSELDALWSVSKDPLSENGLLLVQGNRVPDSPELAAAGVIVVTRIMHESGEWIESEIFVPAIRKRKEKRGLGADPDAEGQGQKPDAQAFGAANSYGRRIALQALLGIPGEENGSGAERPTGEQQPGRRGKSVQPMTVHRVRKDLASILTLRDVYAWRCKFTKEIAESPEKKAIQNVFNVRVEELKRIEQNQRQAA